MMKIGILTQYYPPEIGAPQARLSEIAGILIEQGHQVFIVTAMPNYPTGKIYDGYGGIFRFEKEKQKIILRCFIYPTKKIDIIHRLYNYFSFVISSLLIGTIKLPKLDYLITESPPLFLGMSGYILSRLKKSRWIFNDSDLWPDSAIQLGIINKGIKAILAYKLESFCYRKSWRVIGQSNEIIKNINHRFPEVKTYHLSNGVDINKFHPRHRSEQIREKFSPGNKCLAVYAGLHGIAQGLDQILEALADIKNDKLEILFVGDGPEKEKLMKYAVELKLNNVKFLNPIPSDKMPELIASADIAFVPLKKHLNGAVPSKLYESFAAGAAVILMDSGEAADIVTHNEAGVVVEPGDIKGLTLAILKLFNDPNLRKKYSEAGRQAVEKYFDRKNIVLNFIRMLEQSS
jgi:colanic acid biosynthesis glycosyl transferase WcaI